MKKICIVAPGLIGAIINGGIGAHCHHLAVTLAKESCFKVDVLLTAKPERETNDFWINYYASLNIELTILDASSVDFQHPMLTKSFEIYEALQKKHYDIIHFQDWYANGFVSMQAKEAGLSFHHTEFIIAALSSTEWVREGMHVWNQLGIYDFTLDIFERFCIKHADVLVVPTNHMHEWLIEKKWELPKKVIPASFICEAVGQSHVNNMVNKNHFCFYGRLETRKGLEVFIESLVDFLMDNPEIFKKVSFLGKNATVKEGIDSVEYIFSQLEKFINSGQIEIELLHNFNADEAVEFVQKNGCIAFMPSLMDNLPYAVLDAIQNQLPFMVSNIGGIKEVVDPQILFEPNKMSLIEKFERMNQIDFTNLKHLYNLEMAKKTWIDMNNQPVKKSYTAISPEQHLKQPIIKTLKNSFVRCEFDQNLICFKNDYLLIIEHDMTLKLDDLTVFNQLMISEVGDAFLFYANSNGYIYPSYESIDFFAEMNNTYGSGALLIRASIIEETVFNNICNSEYPLYSLVNFLQENHYKIKHVPHFLSIKTLTVPTDYITMRKKLYAINRSSQKKEFFINNFLVPHYVMTKENPYGYMSIRMQKLIKTLANYKDARIAIFGFNNYGKRIFRELVYQNYKIMCILDSKAELYNEEEQQRYHLSNPFKAKKMDLIVIATDKHQGVMTNILQKFGIEREKIVYF